MNLLSQTISARDLQRQYKSVASRVQKTNQPIVVINRNQPQLALINIQTLEKYQRLLDFSVLNPIQKSNTSVDFSQSFSDISKEVETVRQKQNAKKASSRS